MTIFATPLTLAYSAICTAGAVPYTMEICAPCCSAKCRLQRSCFIFPVVKKSCRACLVWRFRQTFPTRRSLSTSRCLVCRHPWVLLCAASSTRTVGIWSISTLPELSAAVFVFLIQQDLPSVQQEQCIRSYMRLHIAHHQISALFLRLMRRLRQGIRFAPAAASPKGIFSLPGGASASGSYGKFAHSLSVCPLCTHPPTTRHRIHTLSRYRITRNTTKP